MITVSIALLAAVAAAPGAPFDTADWAWRSPVDTAGAPAGYVRVMLVPETFDASEASLDDVRVLDSAGVLVPHVIHWEGTRDRVETRWRPARILNRTFEPEQYERVTLDFGEPAAKNRVRVTLSGAAYCRRAEVEGSPDGQTWEMVSEDGWLFDVAQPGKTFRLNTLTFPANDFQYLRVSVFSMPGDLRRFSIEGVEAALRIERPAAELTPVPVTAMSMTWDEKKRWTVHEIDLGYRNLPVVEIAVEVGDPLFHRGYELVGRNAAVEPIERKTETGWDVVEREAPWQHVDEGVLYRIRHEGKESERVRIDCIRAPYRFLQLRVHEGDNPPLAIEDISVLRGEVGVVFNSEPGEEYALIGGNPKARRPNYDLAKSFAELGEQDLPVVQLAAQTPLEHEPKPLPWTERHGIILWLALILAVGAMLALIATNLRRLRG
ncbi:MAG: DUF3999 family protein [Candidatus Hydrogenedentes bacterium]|nr:DUF3999 family protein [Candidatus Hydrogenedentota bacterium]